MSTPQESGLAMFGGGRTRRRPRRPAGEVLGQEPPSRNAAADTAAALAESGLLPGFVVGVLGVDPSLQQAYTRILEGVRAGRIDPQSPVGRARIQTILRETDFFKGYSEGARAFLLREKTDPGQAAQQLQAQEDELRSQLVQLGGSMPDEQIREVARLLVMGGSREGGVFNAFTARDLTRRVVDSAINWDASVGLTGQARRTEQEVMNAARSYGFGDVIGQQNVRGWVRDYTRRIMRGDTTIEALNNELVGWAVSRYPALERPLRAGVPLGQLTLPYRATLADMLDLGDPDLVSLADPLMERALGSLGAGGEQALQPLWEFKRSIRRDPRWLATDRAMNEYQSIAGRVLADFGFMGGV